MIYPEGVVAHRLARRHGVPFVVTEHAPWTEAWFRSRRVRSHALAAAGSAARLLAVSTSVRDTIVAHGVEPDRVTVVPVGVDAERFSLGPVDRRRSDQILFVGWPHLLLGGEPLAGVVLSGLGIFWFARLITQWGYYDRRLWRGNAGRTAVHLVLTCFWIYLVGICFGAVVTAAW